MTRPLAHGEGPRVPQGRPELRCEGEVTVGASIDALKRLATGSFGDRRLRCSLILDEVFWTDATHRIEFTRRSPVVGSRGLASRVTRRRDPARARPGDRVVGESRSRHVSSTMASSTTRR